LQVRRVDPRQPCAVLVGLFLSLWPLNGPWGAMSWTFSTTASATAQFSQGDGTFTQRSPLPTRDAPPLVRDGASSLTSRDEFVRRTAYGPGSACRPGQPRT
jgi:hypothetical protein